jgi:pSer/pThr/pTyr-binding forkhead associated (FHA) protein
VGRFTRQLGRGSGLVGTDISFLLYWDDDAIPVDGNMTMGNHLDNDIVVPGEDVTDFHARIDLSDRGPVVIPLGTSTLSVNGHERAAPVQLVIGDVIGIGQATMQIGIEVEAHSGAEADSWVLHADAGEGDFAISGEVSVGRAEGADISLHNEHISRFHARLLERHQHVWVQDLNSANGTRVNDTAIAGGVRLFHGDYVSFDKIRFQLIGTGGELTPVQTFIDPLRGTTSRAPRNRLDTTEFTAVEEAIRNPMDIPTLSETGAFLLGISESVDGSVYRVCVGESLVGRGDHCNIVIDDATVSHEHAQFKVRPEGVTVTNLMSTNGTKVNGVDVTSAKLGDGDVVRLGRVSLVFKDIPASSVDQHPLFRRLPFWIFGGTAVVVFMLLLTLIF